ncbi:hypothetical protein M8542_02900 [Amycolatopsis sp. OK19-0408]|uniref:FXSXX-COOH protein n=1 Tax=Amycolatopsis iheyensis TaxID=2945988 RepID=A0A9X2N6L7_9PSEU|nr:hypothetical protein [Amycolatopsis iheyensis]MCR6481757.1 hypothetical protein [Amycolatopsis iheyensis]
MRSTDSEVPTELLDLTRVSLRDLPTLRTPSLNTAIRKVFDHSKNIDVDEVQGQISS